MSDSGWKIVFALAALFNFAAGLPLLLVPAQALEAFGMAQQPMMLFVQVAGSLIVMFGVSYAMIARNLVLRELALLGAIGKLLAVVLLTIYWLKSEIPDIPFYLGFGDLAFALAFLLFLYSRRTAR